MPGQRLNFDQRADLPRKGPGPYAVHAGRLLTDGVEVIVTQHCNLRCRACAYLSPIQSPKAVDPADIEQDLSVLARYYHASEARVLGGEPLLHPELAKILAIIRSSGISDRIRVITNGARLHRMNDAFWSAVDRVSVSVYPGSEPAEENIREIREKAAAHDVAVNFKHFTRFREAYSETGTKDRVLLQQIFQTCQMAHVWRCHTVLEGYLYRCPQSAFLPRVIDELRLSQNTDGIRLTDSPTFLRDLLDFLESDHPPASCSHCLGSVGRLIPNQQIPRSSWRQPQQTHTEELLDRKHLAMLLANPGLFVPDASYLPETGMQDGSP